MGIGVRTWKIRNAILRECERCKALRVFRDVRSPAPSKPRRGHGSVRSRHSRRKSTRPDRRPVSVGCNGGEIAVRAHRHLPQGMRDSFPWNALPRGPKHTGTATTEEPGPRRPAMGVAGTHSGTRPDERRALGLEGVGESGCVRQLTGRKGLGRRSHGVSAGTGVAGGTGGDERRDGFPDRSGRMPLAIIGSGHCLQSRISHDSFLVGYDWGELGCGCSVDAVRSSAIRNFTADCIARVLWQCRGPLPPGIAGQAGPDRRVRAKNRRQAIDSQGLRRLTARRARCAGAVR